MKINLLNPYNIKTNFCAKKDTEQPLTRELREIFSNPEIPKKDKATLWNLSETDSFCAASEGCSKADLLRLSRLINSSPTNIPLMAINGDVKVVLKQ